MVNGIAWCGTVARILTSCGAGTEPFTLLSSRPLSSTHALAQRWPPHDPGDNCNDPQVPPAPGFGRPRTSPIPASDQRHRVLDPPSTSSFPDKSSDGSGKSPANSCVEHVRLFDLSFLRDGAQPV